jgi:2-desacetyl-2-hydroxyethyl bacteriochlorophyllide A dehydrogenase
MMQTKQIVFTKPYTAELLDAECLPPQANEVTVQLEYSAISAGTEKANFIGLRNGTHLSEDDEPVFPRTVGYSSAGTVTALGIDVTDLQIGDRVLVYWGTHRKHITISRSNVIKLPDEISTAEASMAQIATFPLAAVRKTKLEIGESAMVMGLGLLGMFAVQFCRLSGANPVIAADLNEERRKLALQLGADYALDPTAPDFVERVKSLTKGKGVRACVEVTGVSAAMNQALECASRMGRIALLGCTRVSDSSVDYYAQVHKPGVILIGAHNMVRPQVESYPHHWTHQDDCRTILDMISAGRIRPSAVLSRVVKPQQAPEIYEQLCNDRNFPMGTVFDWRK